MKKNRKCDCNLCKRNHKWGRLLKKYDFSKKDGEFLEHIYDTLSAVELDYDVDEAILNGNWTNARHTLEEALKKCSLLENEDKKMNPELKKGIAKLRLMKTLKTDPEKINKEGRNYFCDTCNSYRNNNENFTRSNDDCTDASIFQYGDFCIWKCWKPKK